MKNTSFIEAVDEVIALQMSLIDEVIKEEVKPLIDYRAKLEKEAFEKAYKELRELEEEV